MRMGESDEKEKERRGTKTKNIESEQHSRVCHVCKSEKLNTHERLNTESHSDLKVWLLTLASDYCDECRKVKGWEFLSDERSCCSCQVPFKEAGEGFGGQRGWQPGQKVTFESQVKKSQDREIQRDKSGPL